uniref:protein-tyrosine-phosphatase n=1 Tax=Pygocentrus nattereri TaxID=42514 RepID=A0AAR2K294_PYGNA
MQTDCMFHHKESNRVYTTLNKNHYVPSFHRILKCGTTGTDPFYLIFRVRFFISDPNSLQHEQTRHFYFSQIKKDIREGRLKCPLSSAVVLASYAVQSELGDYVPETPAGYLDHISFIPEQDKDFLIKVESLHPQHKGLSQSEAELCYLNTARTLDLYGVELHSARDANNPSLWVGIASGGVAMFCNLVCSSFFPWINVIKISFKRKRFFIHLRRKHVSFYKSWRSTKFPLYRKLIGDMMWNPIIKSLSTEDLETKSLPSRSPPSTPNWYFFHIHSATNAKHLLLKVFKADLYVCKDTQKRVCFDTKRSDLQFTETQKPHGAHPQNRNYVSYVTVELHMKQMLISKQRCLLSFSIHYTQEDEKTTDGELLLVRISPDQDGKFGFNVKGGVDQKMPLAISHVNPNSPAGRCVPALLEGDQVLLINGRDISEHTHQQVVMFIKASRESHSKELALLVRRKGKNVCLCFPSNCHYPSGETLEEAMVRLERGLTSGTLLLQFEKLYRKNPGLLISCAKLSENMDKNRYKDVLPYDITRVVLQAEEDNYINASHVKASTGAVLQYMAAQGPLPHTCTHFWRSVWEQGVTVIIMLTTLTERGRTKCHQYWPHPPEVKDYDYLQVCCHSEECNLAYVTRELTLKNTQLGQKRSITHLQYVAWPDHGVPEESSDFLDFVQTVRSKRRDTEPLMVHCSAGIGRTGVLITMETALILMESAKPVYPLEIVTSLREQRAMMVQTSCQFSFVCEAILRVYRERFKPSQTPSS